MFTRLRFRLLGSFLLVAMVAVGVVAAVASQAASGQFRGYVEERTQMGDIRVTRILGSYYATQRSWDGVQALVERIGEISGDHVVLVDPRGRVIADSEGRMTGREAERSWSGRPAAIGPRGSEAGFVYTNPVPPQAADQGFLESLNRSLLLAAGAAGVLAVLLTVALSRGISGPIESLISAAQRMEQGNLGQRVEVRGGDEVSQLARAFNSMAEALSRNEMLRRHMVSDVAHELRTPLTNIRGYLEGLRDGVITADSETLDSIHQEAELLGRVVDDLQDLALAEAGQLLLKRQPVALKEVVERAASGVRPHFLVRGMNLETAIVEPLPPVEIDAERVGQVLRNLLNNALSATPEGGTVTMSARPAGDLVEVTVADTGAGIAPEHLPYVFERFYRADPSRTRTTGGAGLGLTIARQIVEAHGCQITAESEPGHGSRFTFSLPAAVHEAGPRLAPTDLVA